VLSGDAGGIRRAVALAVAFGALVCAMALPAVASATPYEVDSTGDQGDALLGDEVCETAAGECTLRAAIQEANKSLGESDTVEFDEALFDGRLAGTITLGSSLPTIVDRIGIEGECVIGSSAVRPCVGIDGPGPAEPALAVENIDEVAINGLAVTGAKTGIEVTGSPEFRAFADWLGVKLDGSAGGNGTGIYLGPGSNEARFGNEAFPDVFANNGGVGLELHGASEARIQGNFFGVRPDGVTPAGNGGDAIEITSESGGFEATRNTIGTELDPGALATPACDGGCNVISGSGSGSSGIDLVGDPAPPDEDSPAVATTIVGNYVGIDASGTMAIPNAADGVRVGSAARTAIGGPRAREANRFAGGTAAVAAGPGAANLAVRGNSIGLAASGAPLAAPGAGIVVDSEGLAAAAEAMIASNEIRMDGGVAIDQSGLGAWILGNRIVDARTGIAASGETEGHGNLITSNVIEGSTLNGVLIESGANELFGNEVLGSGGAGIRIAGAPASFGFSGNLIGGNAGAGENLISGSGGAAIEISNPEPANNEVARNRGFANRGPFIDLVAAAPATEPKGPNEGIKPPRFEVVTQSEASGTGLPKARVRVFRKAGADPGEVESFLGEAIVDADGEWRVVLAASIPGGTPVAASQTSNQASTSELAIAKAAAELAPSAQGCAIPAGCAGAGSPPPVATTTIFKGPHEKKRFGAIAVFKFKASVDGAAFECRLDGKPFRRCHSPMVYSGLKSGRHRFEVRAANAAGQVGPPAKLKFTVLG
jgi:hypothetical protein